MRQAAAVERQADKPRRAGEPVTRALLALACALLAGCAGTQSGGGPRRVVVPGQETSATTDPLAPADSLPLWGKDAPRWAREMGRGWRDSSLVVATLDTLYHLRPTVGVRVVEALGHAAVADSAWLHFHAPRHGARGCEADTSRPERARRR